MKLYSISALLTIITFSLPTVSAYEVTTYQGREVRWNPDDLPARFEINSYGSVDCDGTANAIALGTQHWNDVEGSFFEFVRGPDTDIMNYGQDDHSIIVFYHPEFNQYGQGGIPSFNGTDQYVGVNVFWFRTDTPHYNEIFEFDIIFNGYYYNWDTSENGTEDRFDVENVATHELGHSLSLADLYNSSEREFTMYGITAPAETKKRTLEYDDEDGIIYLYSDGTVDPFRPETFKLLPNFPNPAADNTTFVFTIPVGQNGNATLKIYDLKGRAIKELFNGPVIPDVYQVEWDLTGHSGQKVTPGIYLYRVEFKDEVRAGKLVVNY
ncbi:MAG: T9SS type A sorting domain-containing protein [bacterium]|nr:T9SS type A sorting domain-containing protein [bacterium]